MSNTSKKSKKPQSTRAQRSLRMQRIVAVFIGILVILSMVIGLMTSY